MKRNKILITLLLLTGCALHSAIAQSGLHISSGTDLFIKMGTIFSADSLVLTPSVDFTISGSNALTRTPTATNAYGGTYVGRVFHFAASSIPFSGTIGFYYRDAELNGLSENVLTLQVHEGTSWTPFPTNVTRDATNNIVTTTNLTSVALNELTLADECVTKTTYYRDNDGDGYGNPAVSVAACTQPAGYVTNNTDCDDITTDVNPDDNDGDGYSTCEGDCDDTDASINPADKDGDGYLNSCAGINDCDDNDASKNPRDLDNDGYSSCDGDCDDANDAIYPGAAEACNGIDDDCDGQVDEGLTQYTYYTDGDGDGYGTASTITSCSNTAPQGYASRGGDCKDANAAINPGATEVCDGIDNDCDGMTDEGCATLPTVSISSEQAYEPTGSVTLKVSLSKVSTSKVTVAYATVDGSAISKGKGRNPAIDFVAKKGTLTIPAGQREATITISIINDNIVEQPEQFTVQLSKPVNATIAAGTGTVTINDAAPVTTMVTTNTMVTKTNAPERLSATLFAVKAQPNPSTHYFTLHISSRSNQPVTMQVTDMLGRVVEARSSVATNGSVRIGQPFRPGVYLLTLTQGTNRITTKLVKQSY
jgi:hypothetical protein